MQRSHLIMVTSLKEGWGLIVSEAGSQGTPAVVYDVDGLRDAVEYGKAGYLVGSSKSNEEVVPQRGVKRSGATGEVRPRYFKKYKKLTFLISDFKNFGFKNTPERLAEEIVKALADKNKYNKIREYAYQKASGLTFKQSYEDFKQILNLL